MIFFFRKSHLSYVVLLVLSLKLIKIFNLYLIPKLELCLKCFNYYQKQISVRIKCLYYYTTTKFNSIKSYRYTSNIGTVKDFGDGIKTLKSFIQILTFVINIYNQK